MRRLLVVCAVAVMLFAVFAVTRNNPDVAAAAGPPRSSMPASVPSSTAGIVSASKASVVASNLTVRALAMNPIDSQAPIYLINAGAPNQIFSLDPDAAANTPSPSRRLATAAGTGVAGSLGDGGAAIAAQLDLNSASPVERSGIAVAPDGTVFIADTGNDTIRTIAPADSSEPGVIRSIAGHWAGRQDVALAAPMGIALDRAGDLFLADHAAGAIDVLRAGTVQLEILAHVASPANIAVAPNGGTVFAASPDAGAVFAINTQTRAIAAVPGFSTPLASTNRPTSGTSACVAAMGGASPICPAGLAADGAGNLFVADANSGRILRVDARTNASTVEASGLHQPGSMVFDAAGNLYVAEQGANRIIAFAQMGSPQSNIALSPASAVFGDMPVSGVTATQQFTLTNSSSSTITGLDVPSATSPADFTVQSSSCTVALAPNATCALNIAFTPVSTGARAGSITVTDANPSDSATASFTGTGDDYQIQLANGQLSQISVQVGAATTFNLQVVPDSVFSGPVNIICPTNLPPNTTCVADPATVNVSAGQAAPFTLTFQTTGVLNPLAAAPPRGRNSPLDSPLFPAMALAAIFASLGLAFVLIPAPMLRRFAPAFALLAIAAAALSGCHAKVTAASLGATPAGTYILTVTGTSQNAPRALAITLVVVQR
ncbi:MAG: choice-of-anchor D domain-containing protein [Candidatus Acidiferrales bacterium]